MARISDWARHYKLWVEEVQGQPGETVYKVKYLFSTRDGSWEPGDKPGSVPQWARDLFLFPSNHPQYNDDGGADRHLFGAVLGEGGALAGNGAIHYWTYTDNANHTYQPVKRHGWANIPLFNHSDVPGPWAWQPTNVKADVVKGGGLPGGLHISWFAVWERVVIPGKPEEPEKPPVDPPTEPGQADVLARLARLERALDVLVKEWEGGK